MCNTTLYHITPFLPGTDNLMGYTTKLNGPLTDLTATRGSLNFNSILWCALLTNRFSASCVSAMVTTNFSCALACHFACLFSYLRHVFGFMCQAGQQCVLRSESSVAGFDRNEKKTSQRRLWLLLWATCSGMSLRDTP